MSDHQPAFFDWTFPLNDPFFSTMRFIYSGLFLLFFGTLSAQDFAAGAAELYDLSNTFLKDSIRDNRLQAAVTFEEKLTSLLRQPGSYQYPFAELETVSVLSPADSTFRIFTWQLFDGPNDYRYGGLIQHRDRPDELISLTDESAATNPLDLPYDVLGAEDWYGAIYFNLESFENAEGRYYLLFGFDCYQLFNKRKVVEAMRFDETGQPIFGLPVFKKQVPGYEASAENRLFLEYSAEVAARLNYDPQLNMIIMDNLVAMRSTYREAGSVNVPDGSYQGYQLDGGEWVYVEKVFHQTLDAPPAPATILGKDRPTDLFGNQSKEKRDKNLPFRKNR